MESKKFAWIVQVQHQLISIQLELLADGTIIIRRDEIEQFRRMTTRGVDGTDLLQFPECVVEILSRWNQGRCTYSLMVDCEINGVQARRTFEEHRALHRRIYTIWFPVIRDQLKMIVLHKGTGELFDILNRPIRSARYFNHNSPGSIFSFKIHRRNFRIENGQKSPADRLHHRLIDLDRKDLVPSYQNDEPAVFHAA